MSTENPCIGCQQNCCDGFFFIKEFLDRAHPFVRVIWEDREMMYCTCDNFDKENGVCLDYANRPIFCRNTGANGNFPHDECLLKRPEDYGFRDELGL